MTNLSFLYYPLKCLGQLTTTSSKFTSFQFGIPSLKLTVRPWKPMVGSDEFPFGFLSLFSEAISCSGSGSKFSFHLRSKKGGISPSLPRTTWILGRPGAWEKERCLLNLFQDALMANFFKRFCSSFWQTQGNMWRVILPSFFKSILGWCYLSIWVLVSQSNTQHKKPTESFGFRKGGKLETCILGGQHSRKKTPSLRILDPPMEGFEPV